MKQNQKIRPIILCGGSGSRLLLSKNNKNSLPKQFVDFGGWNLFEKVLLRLKNPIFDTPIISTNKKYLNHVKKYLKKNKITIYKIVVEQETFSLASQVAGSTQLDNFECKGQR